MAAKTFLRSKMEISLLLVALAFAGTVHAKIICVDNDATPPGDGTRWETALSYLQDALMVASSGDEIRVAQGIYKPGDFMLSTRPNLGREETFQLINAVTLKGGYAGFGEPDPNARDIDMCKTILSGDIGITGDNWDNSYHVVTGNGTDETAVFDGFVIRGGNANGSHPHDQGGGMFNEWGNPTLANCTFSGNLADYSGGGMYNSWSSPRLVNCTFISNSAKKGGGMYKHYGSPVLSYCMFTKNWAMSGGGIGNRGNTLMMANCTFSENFAASSGGGMSNDQAGSELSNCTFISNVASLKGGGLSNWHSNSVLTNCILSGNSGGEKGGGMYTFGSMGYKLANCVLVGNTADEEGGGIWNEYTRPIITNCTFAANSAPKGNALACDSSLHPSSIQVSNCILWCEGEEIWNNDASTISITYSDVQDGWPGEGNIDADPCFVDLGYWDAGGFWIDGDYHLLEDSPCINAGDPNYPYDPNETDLDDNPRVIGGRIDMGAYEYVLPILANIRIIPRTISLASSGKWIAAFLRLPEEYNVTDIDLNSILLENEIESLRFWLFEDNQIAIANFSREEVQAILAVGNVELIITGRLIDGTYFEATDTVKVTDKANAKS